MQIHGNFVAIYYFTIVYICVCKYLRQIENRLELRGVKNNVEILHRPFVKITINIFDDISLSLKNSQWDLHIYV